LACQTKKAAFIGLSSGSNAAAKWRKQMPIWMTREALAIPGAEMAK
jgi:hypothetical protein